MPNLHPMVVHFPIALLTTFLILEILSLILKSESLKTGASWMLYAGTLGAFGAVLAGFRAAATLEHSDEIHAIIESHEHLGLVVLLIAVILSLWRIVFKRKLAGSWWIVYLALSIIMVIVMSFGADLGGLMVYTHGVGIKAEAKADPGAGGQSMPANNSKTPHDSTPHKH